MTRRKSHPTNPSGTDDLAELIEQAKRGDQCAVAKLAEELDRRPGLWQQAGDLATHAERAWIEMAAGEDPLLAESLRRKLKALRAELIGESCDQLEVLLVARIVICWLQSHYCDIAYARSTECSLKQANFLMKRQAESHRRFLNAVRTLATVRNLLGQSAKEKRKPPCSAPASQQGIEPDIGRTTCRSELGLVDRLDGRLAKKCANPPAAGKATAGNDDGWLIDAAFWDTQVALARTQ